MYHFLQGQNGVVSPGYRGRKKTAPIGAALLVRLGLLQFLIDIFHAEVVWDSDMRYCFSINQPCNLYDGAISGFCPVHVTVVCPLGIDGFRPFYALVVFEKGVEGCVFMFDFGHSNFLSLPIVGSIGVNNRIVRPTSRSVMNPAVFLLGKVRFFGLPVPRPVSSCFFTVI